MIEIKRTDSLGMVLDKLKQHTYVVVYTANETTVHIPLNGFDSCFFTCTFEHGKLTRMSTWDMIYRGTLEQLVSSIMSSISMCELGDSGYVNMIIHYPESDDSEHMDIPIYEPNDNCNDNNN